MRGVVAGDAGIDEGGIDARGARAVEVRVGSAGDEGFFPLLRGYYFVADHNR